MSLEDQPSASFASTSASASTLTSTSTPATPKLHQRLGLALAPLVFAALWLAPITGLKREAHHLAAVAAAVMILWTTEALPMPLVALIGAAACVVLQVAPAQQVFSSFADPVVFLFIGAFILARALFLHRLDQRLAFGALSIRWIGARPDRVLIAYGAVTMFISAWVSNTAATVMMYAVGMSALAFLSDPKSMGGKAVPARYGAGLMLMNTFAATIGGLATPVGSVPNLVGIGMIRQQLGVEVTFVNWCAIGVPLALGLFLFLAGYLTWSCRSGIGESAAFGELLANQRRQLGPWTRGQRSVCLACAVTMTLWLTPGALAIAFGESSGVYKGFQRSVPEPVAALLGAFLLFLLPGDGRGTKAITWNEAAQIDWGVILLFGGGLTLGALAFQTGLAESLGKGLAQRWLSGDQGFGLLCASVIIAIVVSELTSNTASANMVIPVVIAIAQAAGVNPLQPALAATFAASLGLMFPVSTPGNAIVFGSGLIPLRSMMIYGLILDVVGAVAIIVLVRWIVVAG